MYVTHALFLHYSYALIPTTYFIFLWVWLNWSDTMKLIYVRFGNIPENQMSKNYLTVEYENGVSVYEAIERDNNISIILPSLTGSACVTLSGVLDRPMYIVDGELCGTGSDGEPLLKNCKIVREIKNINHSSEGWL